MSWRVARSLEVLLEELNTAAPNRSKLSDGSIGDAAHAAGTSDHNPNSANVVRARDFTHDPAGGLDCAKLATALTALYRSGTHPALGSGAYTIWRSHIISRDRISEGWRWYGDWSTGRNPHDKHLHQSVASHPSGYDSATRWGITTQEDDMPYTETQLTEIVSAAVRSELVRAAVRTEQNFDRVKAQNARIRERVNAIAKAERGRNAELAAKLEAALADDDAAE